MYAMQMAAAKASFSARLATPVRGRSWNESALHGAASGQRVARRINARLDRVADGNEEEGGNFSDEEDDDDFFSDNEDVSDDDKVSTNGGGSAGRGGEKSLSGTTRVRRRRRGSLGMQAEMQLAASAGNSNSNSGNGSSSRSSGGNNDSSDSRSRVGDESTDGQVLPERGSDASADAAENEEIRQEEEGEERASGKTASAVKHTECPVCGCRVSVEVASSVEFDENAPCEACAAGLLDAEQEAEASWIASVSGEHNDGGGDGVDGDGDGFLKAPASACSSPILRGSVKAQARQEVEEPNNLGGTAPADPSKVLPEPALLNVGPAIARGALSEETEEIAASRKGVPRSDPLATVASAPPPLGHSDVALQPLPPSLHPQDEEAFIEDQSQSHTQHTGVESCENESSTSGSHSKGKSTAFFAMKSSRPVVSAVGTLPTGVVAGSGSAIR